MSSDGPQRESKAGYWAGRAQDALADALALIEQGGSPEGISNRAWFAMLYAVLALLRSEGRDETEAVEALEAFDQVLVKSKAVSAKHGKMASEAARLARQAEAAGGPRISN